MYRAVFLFSWDFRLRYSAAVLQGRAIVPDQRQFDEKVRECATACIETGDPISCANQFVQDLSLTRGWAQPDAEAVVRAALKIVAGITRNHAVLVD
jgi:hypothetical protein